MDCIHWYGLKFNDLDTPAWLPFCTAEVLGQEAPKLTLPMPDESP